MGAGRESRGKTVNACILYVTNVEKLDVREAEGYGDQTQEGVKDLCVEKAQELGQSIDFRQSNHEGELVDWIQQARGVFDGVVINAAAYTHTSVAIHDALKLLDIPIIEVHISDPKTREKFRHNSYIEPIASNLVAGKGIEGYVLALEMLAKL